MSDPEAEWVILLDERMVQLLAQRSALLAAIERTRAARSLEFSDDEHDPDGSTASLDQVRDAALLALTEQNVAEVVAARRRVSSGTFGECEACSQPIAVERLLARPESRTCVACAARRGTERRSARDR